MELLTRGNIARKKNNEIRVSSFVPPQVFDQHLAALNFVKDLREEGSDTIWTVRLGESDVKILTKNIHDTQWIDYQLPKLPNFNNNIFWEGLSSTKIRAKIDDFSPMKGTLPSEKVVIKEMTDSSMKRKEVSPLAKDAKKHK